MATIHEILEGAGVTVPKEKLEDFNKNFEAAYKTAADYEHQSGRIQALQESLKTAEDGLKEFEGVNVNDLKEKVGKLQKDLEEKEREYKEKVSDLEFSGQIASAIRAAKGKNVTAIQALLDVETLKTSKNQGEDIKAALEKLKKENDYLFESENATQRKTGMSHEGGSEGGQGKKEEANAAIRELFGRE